MKLYGGIDLHSNNSVLALLDEDERLVYRKRLANDAPGILGALAPYREGIVGLVVESTYNWYWLVDALGEAGYPVHLANTAAIVQPVGCAELAKRIVRDQCGLLSSLCPTEVLYAGAIPKAAGITSPPRSARCLSSASR